MTTEIASPTVLGSRYSWQVTSPNHQLAIELEKALNLPHLVALILTTRHLTSPAQARDYLYTQLKNLHTPHQLHDLDKAVARIAKALADGERIAIYGDYDVDGVTATVLLVDFLSSLDGKVYWYIPHRVREGYGLNHKALRTLRAKGVTLVITVDCGSSDHEPIRTATDLGMDIIVTDHHRPPDVPPEAYAILNPKWGEKKKELGNLAGVGVAFYLAAALRTHFRTAGRWANSEQPNLKKYLDLVALGTLADMAPLTGTNRILTKVGLIELSRTDRCGLRALKKTCGLDSSTVTDWDVLFKLGPRLNAPGRLASGDASLRLLLSTDPAEAKPLAQELERINHKRQLVEDQLLAEALYMVEADDSFKQRSSLVLASPGWHKGLLGLVASRLVERFNKPTILLTQTGQYWEGSGRSVSNFDLYRAVYRCKDQLQRFGGHRLAVGLGLKQDQLAGFCAAFEELAKEEVSQEGTLPHKKVDAMVRLAEITPELMEYLQCMQPYGVGNPEPIFCCEDFQVEKADILKDRHLQLTVRQEKTRLGCIGFNLMQSEQRPPVPKWLLFSPRWNTWRGKRRIQLHILDYC